MTLNFPSPHFQKNPYYSPMKKALIIFGSSRGDGNTRQMVDHALKSDHFDLINLLEYEIGYYDYNYLNQDDDYLPLMRKIIPQYDLFLFATPVYWYSMSAIMKTFFDRLSDLIRIEKDLGRQLRGKAMAMMSCSGHDDRADSFADPFRRSANYLGMHYLGDVHTYTEEGQPPLPEVLERIDLFIEQIKSWVPVLP